MEARGPDARREWLTLVRLIDKVGGRWRERLGPLAPEPTRLTRCLDGCLRNVGDSTFQFVGVLGADGNESGGAQDAVSRGEAGFLLENVVVLGALLRVLDLPIRWRWAASEIYSVSPCGCRVQPGRCASACRAV